PTLTTSPLPLPRPPRPPPFPYTTLFRSPAAKGPGGPGMPQAPMQPPQQQGPPPRAPNPPHDDRDREDGSPRANAGTYDRYLAGRSEEHTSELQSRGHLVCRLLLEKKKQI